MRRGVSGRSSDWSSLFCAREDAFEVVLGMPLDSLDRPWASLSAPWAAFGRSLVCLLRGLSAVARQSRHPGASWGGFWSYFGSFVDVPGLHYWLNDGPCNR